jgi:hypothetical protein
MQGTALLAATCGRLERWDEIYAGIAGDRLRRNESGECQLRGIGALRSPPVTLNSIIGSFASVAALKVVR